MAELNRNSIYQVLEKNKVKADLIRSIDEILTKCEMAQYSPLTSKDAKHSYDQSKVLFNKFEKNG